MREQRFTFDAVPELYDRARPRYPDALVDDLIGNAALAPSDRVLELGCGTGQLTRALALRGLHVVALEPGPNTAALARERLAAFAHVEVVCSTFEAWPIEPGAFALVAAAQAFHWVAPDVRFTKSAAALAANGHLAVIGNSIVREELRTELDAIYARLAPTLSGRTPMAWYSQAGPIPGLFAESGRFGALTSRSHPWSKSYGTREFLDLLATHSDHRMLEEEQREALFAEVGAMIDAHGGAVRLEYEANLHLARKA